MGCHWKTSLIGSVAIKPDNRHVTGPQQRTAAHQLANSSPVLEDPLGVPRSAYYLFLELMAVCKLDLRAHYCLHAYL